MLSMWSRSILLLFITVGIVRASSGSHLNITAIVSDDHDNARFQCWQLSSSSVKYPTAGGSTMNVTDIRSDIHFVNLPPHSEEGIHNARYSMIFVVLSGLCHVWLPDKSEEFWLGKDHPTYMIATDTRGLGHYTAYPSDEDTLALQIPFVDGKLPEHAILHNGTCRTKHTSSFNHDIPKDGKDEAQEDSIAREIWFTEQGLLQPFL